MGAFVSNSALQANFVTAELPRFRCDLRTRLSHRTHLLQERLNDLETTLAQLDHDASALDKHRQGHALAEIYRKELSSALSHMVDILEDALQAILPNSTSDPISVDLAMFIGRFALHLGTLRVLKGEDGLESPATGELVFQREMGVTLTMVPPL